MPNLYPLIRPVLAWLPREAAHEVSMRALEAGLGRLFVGSAGPEPDPPILRQNLWGLDFTNPIGLAAGYDKDARAPDAMRRLGFGFVEVGTVTPNPQAGNPKPRVFRLDEDRAIVNRMGFNSGGTRRCCRPAVPTRPRRHRRRKPRQEPGQRGCRCRLRIWYPPNSRAGELSGNQHLVAEHAGAARPASPRAARFAAAPSARRARKDRLSGAVAA